MGAELPQGCTLHPLERHEDQRGSFVEVMRAAAEGVELAQIGVSTSRRGALRGLHFHRRQTDVWHLLDGHLQVALVDLRVSETPRPQLLELSGKMPSLLVIPPLVAHGYLALEDSRVLYLFSHEFDGTDEFGIAWDDPDLSISWANTSPILSERDRANPRLAASGAGE